ncbi:MAG: hypothetical protein M0Z31_04590 [Clostridia bacterium]|nr:hypothetical protein [Clostridia bacterium]
MALGATLVSLGVFLGIWGTFKNKSFGILGTSSVLMASGIAVFILGLFTEG